jgi:hypothetical protein
MDAEFLAQLAAGALAKRAEIPPDTTLNRYTRDRLAAQAACFALGSAGLLADEGEVLHCDLTHQITLRARYGVDPDP